MRFGLRANAVEALAQAITHLPLGWRPSPPGEVDILYSLRIAPASLRQRRRNYHLLYCGSELVARTLDLPSLWISLEKHAELLTAFRAQDCLFVHAGVVGWKDAAVLIPGRSMTGKTTLVKALVEAGADYYSDEFAILDKQGQVHPYPVSLSIRGTNGQAARKISAEALGGQTGMGPLPVRLMIVTVYQPGATWQPRKLSPGQALLALMDNTVAAQRSPTYSMPILKQAVARVITLKSKRGEAAEVAPSLLSRLEKFL